MDDETLLSYVEDASAKISDQYAAGAEETAGAVERAA